MTAWQLAASNKANYYPLCAVGAGPRCCFSLFQNREQTKRTIPCYYTAERHSPSATFAPVAVPISIFVRVILSDLLPVTVNSLCVYTYTVFACVCVCVFVCVPVSVGLCVWIVQFLNRCWISLSLLPQPTMRKQRKGRKVKFPNTVALAELELESSCPQNCSWKYTTSRKKTHEKQNDKGANACEGFAAAASSHRYRSTLFVASRCDHPI